MWRPYNETEQDLQNEAAVAEILSKKWGCDIHKLSEKIYPVDWVFSRDKIVVAYGEYKKRAKKYDTTLLSVSKYYRMIDLLNMAKVPVLLIIEWPDGIYYLDLSWEDMDLKAFIGGSSRGQNGDIEPIVYIPNEKFSKIIL